MSIFQILGKVVELFSVVYLLVGQGDLVKAGDLVMTINQIAVLVMLVLSLFDAFVKVKGLCCKGKANKNPSGGQKVVVGV